MTGNEYRTVQLTSVIRSGGSICLPSTAPQSIFLKKGWLLMAPRFPCAPRRTSPFLVRNWK